MLDMTPGSNAPTSSYDRTRLTVALLLIFCATLVKSAPTTVDEIEPKRTDIADYYANSNGCYYNYQHYEEGDRIVTNEPCLNCTCHNRMLMCFLRVCPFTKAIGQDCTVQKSPDQCCPTISCPEVPVELLTSSTTPQPTTTTTVGWQDNYGCMMNDNKFFPDGAQLPIILEKPCELCYCIRNRTACVMQECTLHVEGCRPVYLDGVCCPVRYDCDYENDKSTTSTPQITGGLVFSTTSAPFDCRMGDEVYNDGESIPMLSEKPCHHCYCMRGDIVCAVQDCGEPLRGKDCTPEPPPAGQCCPTSYRCANDTINSDDVTTLQPISLSDSDEHEAEKHPSLEEAYEKLGENQPTIQDSPNSMNSDEVHTESSAEDEQSTNKNEAMNNSVNENQSNADEQAGISEVSATTQSNEQPASETVNQDNPVVVASDENTNAQETGTTNSPIEVNLVSSTPQQTSDDKTDVKITEENTNTKNPSEQINQDENKTTNPISNETAGISQTESPITTNQDSNTPINDDKNENSEINTESNIKQDAPLQSNQDSTERPVEVVNAQTDVPFEVDQSTLKQSEQDNAQVPQNDNNIGQNNQYITQTPEVNVVQTETPSIVAQEPSSQINQDETEKPLDETISQTEVPISLQQEPVSEINQDSTARPQEENVSQADIPTSVQQEPVSQSNNDSTQGSQEENALTTDIPSSVAGESPSQNDSQKPQEEVSSPTELPTGVVQEPASQNEEEKPQEENEIHTESPISENKPMEQVNEDKPESESNPQTNALPDLEKKPDNQEDVQNENVLATTKPLDTNNDEAENTPTQPSFSQGAVVAQVSTEQPVEQDHIIMVSPTAPPLYAHDQIKDDVPLQTPAVSIENNNNVKDTLIEENKTEISQTAQTPSSDEASSPGTTDIDNVPATNPVNAVPENDKKSPNENTSENIISDKIDSSTETKPTENEIVNDVSISVTESPVDSGEQKPENDQPVNNRFSESSVNKVNVEAVSPTKESNIEVRPDSETGTQTALLDSSSEPSITLDNATEQPISLENQASSETPTNAPPSSDDISEGTTQLPQQQLEDNNIPSQSVNLSPDEPTKIQDEPEKSSEPSESPIDLTSVNNQETTEPQHSDNVENAKPTDAPASENGEIEQIASTAAPEINDNIALQQQQQPQNEATNVIVEATTTFDEPSSSEKNELKVVTESAPSNEADVSTTLPEQIAEDEKPVLTTNEDKQVENDSTHNPQTEQVSLISSNNNVDSDDSASTNKYTEEVESTVSPASISSSNDESLNNITPIATSDNKPESENAVEASTQNIFEDASTNTPIVNANDSPANTDTGENVETGTNAPSSQENQDIQSSTSEPDSYNTQTPVVSQDSKPSNDVTSEVISSIPDTSAPSTDNQNEVESNSSLSATQAPESESYNTQPTAVSQDSGSSNDVTSEVVSSMTDTNALSTEKNQNEVELNSLSSATQAPELNIDVVTIGLVESPSNTPTSDNNENEASPATEINGSPADKIVEATTVVDDNSQGVPGEGSCLVEFVTYAHKAEVPKSNPCHEKCECLNSIVSCTSINCPPPPPNHKNCIPLHPGNESWCCPTYMCDGGIDQGLIFESHNQVRPNEVSTELPESKPTEGNDINASGIKQEPNTASPEVSFEYNTLAPTLTETSTNSDVNPNISEGSNKPEINKVSENLVTPEKDSLPSVTAVYSEPSENENPTENSLATGGVTSVSYENGVPTPSVNKADDMAEQNPSISPVSESQDVPAQPTESQNLESSTTKVEPANDQNQPEQQTSELDDTTVGTANKPSDLPAVEQSNDNNANDIIIKTPTNEESDVKQTENATEQPIINPSPSDFTQSAIEQADSSPTQLPIETIPNDTRPPSTIDDILSSVNLVKGVLNSLETSSKPSEIDYQPTEAVQVSYETTDNVEGSSFSPSSSDATSQITSEQASFNPSSPDETNKLQIAPEGTSSSSSSDDIPQITTEQASLSSSSLDEPNKPQSAAEEASSSPSSSDEPNKPQSAAGESSSSPSSSDDIPQITTEQALLSSSSLDEPNKPHDAAEEASSSPSSSDDTSQITSEQASSSPSSSDDTSQITSEQASTSPSSSDDTSQITSEQASSSPSSSDDTSQITSEQASISPSSPDDIPQITTEQASLSSSSSDEPNKPQSAAGESSSSPSSSDDIPQITTEQASLSSSSSDEPNKPQSAAGESSSSPSSSDDTPQITSEQASFSPSLSEEQNKPEITAEVPSSPSSSEDISQTTAGKPESLEEPNQSQPISEVNAVTNAPEIATEKAPEAITQNSQAPIQLEVSTDAAVNKPEENQNSAVPVSEVNTNPPEAVTEKDPETSSPAATNAPSSQYTTAEKTEGVDNRFSSPTSSQRPTQEEIKIPQETGNKVQIPFGTEAPESYKPPSTPVYTHRPSFSSIPQSSWTQKPFHPDSTSETPQPDQGFPDEYEDENEAVFGPGTCRYGGKIYVSAQQVPRDDPCDFCFCFRGDIICLQQSCPPPIFGCFQDTIQGFCCPRYECPVAQATQVNVTTTTTTTTTTVPPHFFANAYRGAARRSGCLIHGHAYKVGEDVGIASGPCMQCICGDDGKMQCNPKACSPEPVLRKMLAEAVDRRR